MESKVPSGWKPIKATPESLRISNPIRDIVDKLQASNPDKEIISLSIGDPTVFGNFNNPDLMNEKLIEHVQSRKFNGYPHSAGYVESRKAIAKKFSTEKGPLTADDVIVTSGASHAIELCIGVLASEGQNILSPAPGFSLYQVMCDYKGVENKCYRLLPEKNWEVDLEHLDSLIDSNTAAILVNNPSNPCGSVYTKKHLQDILKVAEKHRVPIISDEIYADMVFSGNEYNSLNSLSDIVPILTVGGIAKQYLVPGWRLGWVLIHDPSNSLFTQVRVGLVKLTQVILGANSLIQSIIPSTLFDTPKSFYEETNNQLQKHAFYLHDRLSKINGLQPIRPGGTMYLMFGIDFTLFRDISDDVEFARALRAEESVGVLPGTIFKCPGFIRLVITAPEDKLKEACDRIEEFCNRHKADGRL